MVDIIELKTDRLKMRQWRKEDWSLFAEINNNPIVMEYFPKTLSESESNEMADKICSLISECGWGFWALEEMELGK